jgi:hypothetical protein
LLKARKSEFSPRSDDNTIDKSTFRKYGGACGSLDPVFMSITCLDVSQLSPPTAAGNRRRQRIQRPKPKRERGFMRSELSLVYFFERLLHCSVPRFFREVFPFGFVVKREAVARC